MADNHVNEAIELDRRFDQIIGFEGNRIWFTTPEASKYLNVSERALKNLRDMKILTYLNAGHKIWYNKQHLDKIKRTRIKDRRAMI